jgi:hypothetical protein
MHLCCLGVMKKLLHHWLNRETISSNQPWHRRWVHQKIATHQSLYS